MKLLKTKFYSSPGVYTLLIGAICFLFLNGCSDSKVSKENKTTEKNLNQTVERGPVKAVVIVTPENPTFADLITFSLTIHADPKVKVEPPNFGELIDGRLFSVLNHVEEPAKLEGDKTVYRFRYQLEPEQTGDLILRALPIVFTVSEGNQKTKGKKLTLHTKPITISILNIDPNKKPKLSELKPAAAPMPIESDNRYLWIAATLTVLLGGGLIAIFALRKRPEGDRKPNISPEQWALKALDALQQDNLIGRGMIKEFYVRLTGIVRRYIEKSTGLNAPDQTTEEFLQTLRGEAKELFSPDRARALAQFLEASDLVKYAAAVPNFDETQEAYLSAKAFVTAGDGDSSLQKIAKEKATQPIG